MLEKGQSLKDSPQPMAPKEGRCRSPISGVDLVFSKKHCA